MKFQKISTDFMGLVPIPAETHQRARQYRLASMVIITIQNGGCMLSLFKCVTHLHEAILTYFCDFAFSALGPF